MVIAGEWEGRRREPEGGGGKSKKKEKNIIKEGLFAFAKKILKYYFWMILEIKIKSCQ